MIDEPLTYDEAAALGMIEVDDAEPVFSQQDTGEPESVRRRTSWAADELMATVFPEPRWAVPGLLAEGVNLLVGAPKLGKSWLALNLSVSIASGGRALGTIDVDEGDVLYLALEDTGRRLQSRMRAVLGTDPPPARLRLATECEPLYRGGSDRIERWLDTTPDARLVVVDVLTKLRGRSNDKTNRYEADYGAIAGIKDLADRYGISFVVVHHTRKAQSDDFLDAVSGTQGLAGAADAVLVLSRSRGAATAVLKITGRDVEEASHALDFHAPTGTWRLLEGSVAEHTQSDKRSVILEVVRANPGIGPKDVADKTAITYDSVRQLVRRMVDTDVLTTDHEGHYFECEP